MQVLFCQLPGLHRVLEPPVAAQGIPLALEADSRPPRAFGDFPVHAGDAAGVVFPHGLGPQHFHAGPVHIGQGGEARVLAAAAGAAAAAQVVGLRHHLSSAVAPAQPGRPPPDVLRRPDHGQLAEPLPCQVQLFPGVSHIVRPLSVDKIYLLSLRGQFVIKSG